MFDQFSFNSYILEVTVKKKITIKKKSRAQTHGGMKPKIVLIMQLFLELYFKNWYVTSI